MAQIISNEKKQFDSTLGGEYKLPNILRIREYVEARSKEIAYLNEALDNPQRVSLLSQRIPRHMQRRIMSHNSKRLPVALREAHIEMRMKSGNISVPKRPSRKYRRRPRNLLEEYNRRQKNFIWLETHIWHAKRFHMLKLWNYSIPDHPNGKNFRACYRAMKEHCLLQDVSYYVCLEINGGYNNIVNTLSKLTASQNGLTFAAKYYSGGSREGSTIVYHEGQYPYGAIGVVNFLWQPEGVIQNDSRKLWLWIHPSYYNELLDELKNVFVLNKQTMDESESPETDSSRFHSKVIVYKSDLYNDVTVIELKDTINRLRLIGPLAQSIITDAFKLLNFNDIINISESESDSKDWIKCYYRDKEKCETLKKKSDLWEKFRSVTNPSMLPNRMVLPLVIRDLRFNLPQKRTKALIDIKDVCNINLTPSDFSVLTDSPFWDYNIRKEVTENKYSTCDINKLLSKLILPGSIEILAEKYNVRHYLPIILIQNSTYPPPGASVKNRGVISGWDIIIPSGWSMPVWLSLVWRGARVGGLRETKTLCHESNTLYPILPDSAAGVIENERQEKILKEIYFKKPPAKRTNYKKHGIIAPFSYPWKELLKSWNVSDTIPSSFFVLRDRIKLNKVNELVNNLNKHLEIEDSLGVDYLEMNSEDFNHALVALNVEINGSGTICSHSIICLPLLEDFVKDSSDWAKMSTKLSRPTEINHSDEEEIKRKTLRKEHLRFLKQMRKKRKNSKSNEDFVKFKMLKKVTEENIFKTSEELNRLWLPNLSKANVKGSCGREVLGFIVEGGFSNLASCSTGQGYVPLSSLLHLLKTQSDLLRKKIIKSLTVLIREPTSLHYSYATISLSYNSFL